MGRAETSSHKLPAHKKKSSAGAAYQCEPTPFELHCILNSGGAIL